jgi:Flp pilus assembly protein CpaB
MMSCVTSTLGTTEPPPAARVTAPGWRDPRLWIGLVLVAASVLVGARVLARADESVTVWAAVRELPAGHPLTPDDLRGVRVRFLAEGDRERYLSATAALPEPATLLRPVGAGELVPADAVGDPGASGLLSVPLSVSALAVPPDVGPGSVVDVWVTTETESGRAVAKPLLTEVLVLAAPAQADGFGAGGNRQLVLGVAPEQADALGKTLAARGDSGLTVVGRD